MTRPIAVLICPGRGAYGANELGTATRGPLSAELAAVLEEADAVRRDAGRPTITELDRAERFRPGLHLDGRNAAELIWFATMACLERVHDAYDIVAICGNSLGWYTTLPAAGTLPAREGWQLVTTMAELQQRAVGGQILTTTVGDDWRVDPGRARAVERALHDVAAIDDDHYVAESIRLGGHRVLAGTERGVQELLARLPKIDSDARSFPFRLAGHGPFHTRLCDDVATEATRRLAPLPLNPPRTWLIDGVGDAHSPWSTDPEGLRDYTADVQVRTTFDFSAAIRTALREFQPDVLLCAPPGSTLRAPVGHVVIGEGYRGIGDRDALFASDLVRLG